MARPSVDLPQPDSPTNPSVSPRLTKNETSSTAWSRPRGVLKYFFRWLTTTIGWVFSCSVIVIGLL